MAKIIWTKTARNDIKDIYDYIAKDSKYYANMFIENIKNETKKLKSYPELGRVVPEYNKKRLRELIYKNYRIIYKLEEERIAIITIFHSARDLFNFRSQK